MRALGADGRARTRRRAARRGVAVGSLRGVGRVTRVAAKSPGRRAARRRRAALPLALSQRDNDRYARFAIPLGVLSLVETSGEAL